MVLSGPKRHTDKTGDISEAAIITRLLQSSYVVLTPYGKNHRYDLLIEDAEGQYWRIQCKKRMCGGRRTMNSRCLFKK